MSKVITLICRIRFVGSGASALYREATACEQLMLNALTRIATPHKAFWAQILV